jgi:hypothetical protein
MKISFMTIVFASLTNYSGLGQKLDKPCDGSSLVNSRVQLERGSFRLNFIDMSHPLGTRHFLDTKFMAREYKTTNEIMEIPEISINNCLMTSRLSTLYFKAKSAIGLELNGKTFAYVVFAQLRTGRHGGAIGAEMNIIFYDMNGNGVFNSVQTAVPYGIPFIPPWVK